MTLDRFFTSAASTSIDLTVEDDTSSEPMLPETAKNIPIENGLTSQLETMPVEKDTSNVETYHKTQPKMMESNNTNKTPANGEPSTSKKTNKKPRAPRRTKPTSLKNKLKGLNADQFIELIQNLTEIHPNLNDEIALILPKPDLNCHKETLEKLNRCIHKSLPYTKYGSDRDTFCYRRVATHLQNFKKSCLEQGRRLVESEAWQFVMEYTFIAWDVIQETPLWDDPGHNKTRELCFRGVASMCLKALKKSNLEEDEYDEIKSRLEEAAEVNMEIQPCLAEVEKILQKF